MEDSAREFRDSWIEFLRHLEEFIDVVPMSPFFKAQAKQEIKRLREMLIEQRPPRFAIVGRRGAGKSTLVNALFGERVAEVGSVEARTRESTWYTYTGSRGTLRLMDTRGIQEGSHLAADDPAFEGLLQAFRAEPPDTILFLCKAKEVDAAVGTDVEFLARLYEGCQRVTAYAPPVLGVVTQVDELDPPDIRNPAEFGDPEKAENIRRATEVLRGHLAESRLPPEALIDVLPVNAYIGFRADGGVRIDYRWQVDQLIECLATQIPQSAQVQFARLSQVKRVQREIAQRVVKSFAVAAGAIAAVPVPVADLIPITALQATMVLTVATISGRQLGVRAAAEFAAAMGLNMGAALGLREAARQLLKLIPVAGSLGSTAIATAGTFALGRAAIAYYIEGASIEASRALYERAKDKEPGADGEMALPVAPSAPDVEGT